MAASLSVADIGFHEGALSYLAQISHRKVPIVCGGTKLSRASYDRSIIEALRPFIPPRQNLIVPRVISLPSTLYKTIYSPPLMAFLWSSKFVHFDVEDFVTGNEGSLY